MTTLKKKCRNVQKTHLVENFVLTQEEFFAGADSTCISIKDMGCWVVHFTFYRKRKVFWTCRQKMVRIPTKVSFDLVFTKNSHFFSFQVSLFTVYSYPQRSAIGVRQFQARCLGVNFELPHLCSTTDLGSLIGNFRLWMFHSVESSTEGSRFQNT